MYPRGGNWGQLPPKFILGSPPPKKIQQKPFLQLPFYYIHGNVSRCPLNWFFPPRRTVPCRPFSAKNCGCLFAWSTELSINVSLKLPTVSVGLEWLRHISTRMTVSCHINVIFTQSNLSKLHRINNFTEQTRKKEWAYKIQAVSYLKKIGFETRKWNLSQKISLKQLLWVKTTI